MKTTTEIAIAGIVTIVLVALTGCTTAGPFVTSISSDGKGDIIVEKNTVHLNAFTGVVSTGEHPTTQVIRILPQPGQQSK